MTIQQQIAPTPAQEQAFEWLLDAIPIADVLVLRGRAGAGKSTILTRVHAALGGILLGLRTFTESLASHQPSAIEDALLQVIERALAASDLVIVDDLHMVTKIVRSGGSARTYLLDAALTAILAEAAVARKKLVFSMDGDPPWPIQRRAYSAEIAD
jgi:ABC-type transport system involved in cytochrome c biogenesis ATPase subunit